MENVTLHIKVNVVDMCLSVTGDVERCRVFLYHVCRCQYLSYPTITLAVALVWPAFLHKSESGLSEGENDESNRRQCYVQTRVRRILKFLSASKPRTGHCSCGLCRNKAHQSFAGISQ